MAQMNTTQSPSRIPEKARVTSAMLHHVAVVFVSTFLTMVMWTDAVGQSPAQRIGTVQGRVYDRETLSPLVGANVSVIGTERGAISKPDGSFVIDEIPVGTYVLKFSYVGYEPLSRTDVIVRSDRITFADAKLRMSAVEHEGIQVTAGYFSQTEEQPGSAIDFSSEEVRRSPGTAGDVSRIVATLPSIAKVNDQLNSLIVRGGTPTENGFYLDNIEIPNINHYPLQGSSGGPIGLLNVDFIQDVNFSAGGYSSLYGDRLSSIMELEFREGNREELDLQLDLHFAGAGATGEGPIANGRGSWMFSARRSYLDMLVDAIGTGVAPKYSDYQGKVVYDMTPSNRISALGVFGIDFIEFDKESSEEDGNTMYGEYRGHEYAVGMNWRYLWSRNGYSETSISALGTKYDGEFLETKSDILLSDESTLEQMAQIRNVNSYRFNENHRLELGFECKLNLSDYDFDVAEYTNPIGDTTPPLSVDKSLSSPKVGAFISHTSRILPQLTVTYGARLDYFEFNKHTHISPRFSISYKLTDRTSLHGATGIYYQNLPLGLLSQKDEYSALKDPRAYHYVAGFSHLLSENTKLTVEGYVKKYENFPVDTMQPDMFVADESIYQGFFGVKESLLDDGVARAYGGEITVQKKLVEGIYGLVSASLFKSEYRGRDGTWHDRIFDNRLLFSAEGGYKPNEKWEFSLRWIYAGGAPYTPLDIDKSREINRSVLDRNRINEERYPDYHSLNLRADRRFYFGASNLIVYLSIWNAYNRENVSNYYWNEIDKKQDVYYQWSMLPVLGIEFEF
jgi:hypothetical protein